MSQRAYARHRGVDEKSIRKAVAAGKIPLVDGRIDPEVADGSWAPNQPIGELPRYQLSDLTYDAVCQLYELVAQAIRDNHVPIPAYGGKVDSIPPYGLKKVLQQLDDLRSGGVCR